MRKTALLGALLLTAAAPPALAQFAMDDETDEGRSHLNMGADRAVIQACRSEASEKNLAGKERRRYINECQKRDPPPSAGASGMSGTTSGERSWSAMPDPDGRSPAQDLKTSRFAREGSSTTASRPAIPDLDAEGRPRLH